MLKRMNLQRNDWRMRYDGVRDEEKLSEHYELLKKAMFIKVCACAIIIKLVSYYM